MAKASLSVGGDYIECEHLEVWFIGGCGTNGLPHTALWLQVIHLLPTCKIH